MRKTQTTFFCLISALLAALFLFYALSQGRGQTAADGNHHKYRQYRSARLSGAEICRRHRHRTQMGRDRHRQGPQTWGKLRCRCASRPRPAAEKEYVKAGYGINRRQIMYNDFVLIGPASDPAGIKGKSVANSPDGHQGERRQILSAAATIPEPTKKNFPSGRVFP